MFVKDKYELFFNLNYCINFLLLQFIEKFQEVKEATRSGKTNGTINNMAVTGGGGTGPSNAGPMPIPAAATTAGTMSATASPLTTRAKIADTADGIAAGESRIQNAKRIVWDF